MKRKRNPELSFEAGDLILFADNTEQLYKDRQRVVRWIVKQLNRGTYTTAYGRNVWHAWLQKAADRYKRELGTRIPAKAITEAAAEYERDTLKEIHSGEWEWVEELIKRRPNPRHKTVTTKKRRSAAQIRATKKMIAAARARRRTQRPATAGKKKVRRRNPVGNTIRGNYLNARADPRQARTPVRAGRRLNPINYYGIKSGGRWFNGRGWTTTKNSAAMWKTLKTVRDVAQTLSDRTNKSVTVHTM